MDRKPHKHQKLIDAMMEGYEAARPILGHNGRIMVARLYMVYLYLLMHIVILIKSWRGK